MSSLGFVRARHLLSHPEKSFSSRGDYEETKGHSRHALIGENRITSIERAKSAKRNVHCRAYEIYESRGRVDGDDLDDWLQAERDLKQ